MARRKRNWLPRSCYHLTHRCIDKQHLFQYSMTRDLYVMELWKMINRYKVDILNYCVTGNHVHLLVYAGDGGEIEKGMQYLQGRMGQRYNNFKKRHGAFWCGRYHATLVERGSHLSQCIFYIDYNMMRAGVVDHPSGWKQCGYHDIVGSRKHYKIVNRKKLLMCLGLTGNEEKFMEWYNNTIESKSDLFMARQSQWSEALAVGSEEWIEGIRNRIDKKRIIIDKSKPIFKYTQKGLPSDYSISEKSEQYAIYPR